MIVYRCDRCGKEVQERSDLFRLTLHTEKYDKRSDFMCYVGAAGYPRIEKELCADCMREVRTHYFNYIGGNNDECK